MGNVKSVNGSAVLPLTWGANISGVIGDLRKGERSAGDFLSHSVSTQLQQQSEAE